jgi:hypothetical protein
MVLLVAAPATMHRQQAAIHKKARRRRPCLRTMMAGAAPAPRHPNAIIPACPESGGATRISNNMFAK